MAKKTKHSLIKLEEQEFEDLLVSQREPLPKGSLLESVWLLAKYSEKERGYTCEELAAYFKVEQTIIRSAASGLCSRNYFVAFINEKKPGLAGVLRDVFSSDIIWEISWDRRLRQYLLPHMQRVASFGELTAYARPHLLPKVKALMEEANQEWSDSRKRITRSLEGAK